MWAVPPKAWCTDVKAQKHACTEPSQVGTFSADAMAWEWQIPLSTDLHLKSYRELPGIGTGLRLYHWPSYSEVLSSLDCTAIVPPALQSTDNHCGVIQP